MASGSPRLLRLTALGGSVLVAIVGARGANIPALVLMLDFHGGANAIGFSLAGLGALTLLATHKSKRSSDAR